MNSLHEHYLDLLGVTRWQYITSQPLDSLEELRQCVHDCQKCGLERTRRQIVFGSGSPTADLLIVGEAPGANEDQQGLPFVGRAGMLLTEMLKAIGLDRESIYITNILKCRPPQNRDPLPFEVESCTPYLKEQIKFLNPKIIVAVGRIAAHFLLDTKSSLNRLRGKTYDYADTGVPLLVTYHPAYLLRNPADKSKAYEDLLRVQQLMEKV